MACGFKAVRASCCPTPAASPSRQRCGDAVLWPCAVPNHVVDPGVKWRLCQRCVVFNPLEILRVPNRATRSTDLPMRLSTVLYIRRRWGFLLPVPNFFSLLKKRSLCCDVLRAQLRSSPMEVLRSLKVFTRSRWCDGAALLLPPPLGISDHLRGLVWI